MFENVGAKLKTLAMVEFILGIIGSVILGLFLTRVYLIIGLTVILGGIIASWVTALLLYGVGETMEYTQTISQWIKTHNYTVPKGVWKCDSCGRENRDYITTCACGKNRHR